MDTRQRLRQFIRRPTSEEREKIVKDIAESASPAFDFFLLVVLSCSIATMGLVTNSPAVIIGAMLVAPLMSPIIGLGLASITGKARLAESALLALALGGGLAVLLSTIMTLVNRSLPFVALYELPGEVMARTHPSPIDLVIALAGGLAAAYAMTRPNISAALPGVAIATALMPPLCTVGIGLALENWSVAGGALLLFVTNAITIAFAAALVFFLQGFAPRRRSEEQNATRSLLIAAGLTLTLLIPLSYYSVKFFNEANENRSIQEIISNEVGRVNGSELIDLDVQRIGDGLDMVITVRTSIPLKYEQVTELQKSIATSLQQPVTLKVNQVLAEQFDPLIPPTFTSTAQFTSTPTLIPSATVAYASLPTGTSTITSTPGLVQVANGTLPPLSLYQAPGGPVIGQIRRGQMLYLLDERQEFNGIIWLKVMDHEGRVGWIPELYLYPITATP
ncbi:MAG: DUF389 domain-containing protein [Chloroflexi bacterium CFX2]|nr:DUF389 domain-containing protein [Chloroflexi bacterium CFX2]